MQIPKTKIALRPPKLTLKRETHNPNVREAQNYSIVEYLAQAPYAMLALEVLQSFPTQQKALLSFLGTRDSSKSNIISFDIENDKPHLPHYVSIQIQVSHTGLAIWRIVVDEGASTCVMSIDC